jgi:glycerol-3-phosphate dehydrogenase
MNGLSDVIIIGAGIVGCAAAHALGGYELDVLVVERDSDVACGATKANSGILHAGYDCRPGTLKAELNVRGLAMYSRLVRELDIPCRNNGSMVICVNKKGASTLHDLYERGIKNGVTELKLLNGEEARRLEPNLHPDVTGALLAETACVMSPYEAAVAFAENAAVNGVKFLLNTAVTGITHCGDVYTVETPTGPLTARVVINAAGLNSGAVNNYVCEKKEQIIPQHGQYYILDNTRHDLVTRTIFPLPSKWGKGILATPSVDYNILLGPSSEDMDDLATTKDGLDNVLEMVSRSLAMVPARDKITAFAGIRAKHVSKDFVINEPLPGFINAVGIDSPGLTAAPAIAEKIAGMAAARLQPAIKQSHQKERAGIKRFHSLTSKEQAELIRENPAYGNVVCRCETVTEAEIVEAIRRPVGARDLDALKRRTRAQMGRCQGGFCTLRLVEILSRELNIPEAAVTKNGPGSELIMA